MAISIKIKRTSSANVFLVTAGAGDTGKLQIQYNGSDIYNNLSGSTNDIIAGATNTTINCPVDANGEIKKGTYYFNFVASAGDSDTSTINFQISALNICIGETIDCYTPSFKSEDDTNYLVSNGTVSSATRTLTVQYPTGSNQSDLTASASDVTTDLYSSTANVWNGAMQTTLSYDVTYTIAATTGFDTFVYQVVGVGYSTIAVACENTLCDLYCCLDGLRKKVNYAATNKRADYSSLLTDYVYASSLVSQYRQAISCGKTDSLNDIALKIKSVTNCDGCGCTDCNDEAPTKVYGVNTATPSNLSIADSASTLTTSAGKITFLGDVTVASSSADSGDITVTFSGGSGSGLSATLNPNFVYIGNSASAATATDFDTITTVTALSASIGTNTSNISTVSGTAGTNASNISTLSSATGTNTTNISTLQGYIKRAQVAVSSAQVASLAATPVQVIGAFPNDEKWCIHSAIIEIDTAPSGTPSLTSNLYLKAGTGTTARALASTRIDNSGAVVMDGVGDYVLFAPSFSGGSYGEQGADLEILSDANFQTDYAGATFTVTVFYSTL